MTPLNTALAAWRSIPARHRQRILAEMRGEVLQWSEWGKAFESDRDIAATWQAALDVLRAATARMGRK